MRREAMCAVPSLTHREPLSYSLADRVSAGGFFFTQLLSTGPCGSAHAARLRQCRRSSPSGHAHQVLAHGAVPFVQAEVAGSPAAPSTHVAGSPAAPHTSLLLRTLAAPTALEASAELQPSPTSACSPHRRHEALGQKKNDVENNGVSPDNEKTRLNPTNAHTQGVSGAAGSRFLFFST